MTSQNRQNNKPFAPPRAAVYTLLLAAILTVFIPGCRDEKTSQAKSPEFEIDKTFERGPLTVHVKLEKDRFSIADTVWLQLQANIKQGYELQMPALADVLAEFELAILDYKAPPDKLGDENSLIITREYRLEPVFSGSFSLPQLKFTFREKSTSAEDPQTGEDKDYELLTEQIPLEVTSLVDKDRDDLTLADIRGVAALESKLSKWWIWSAIAAAVLAAAVVLLIVLLHHKKEKLIRILKPAHEIAYEALARLVKQDLIAKGQIKQFYEQISDILRHYIEHRFDLKAPERTTEEFLQEAGATNALSEDHKKMLQQFLELCDLVKFARYGPSKEEIQKTFDLTKQFIEMTRLNEIQIDVTDRPPEPSAEMLRSD